jgi:hypothetical protein
VTEGDIGYNVLMLENDLGESVEVSYQHNGTAEVLGQIQPGGELAVEISGAVGGLNEDQGLACTVVELVAVAQDGTTLARLPPPVCGGPGGRTRLSAGLAD